MFECFGGMTPEVKVIHKIIKKEVKEDSKKSKEGNCYHHMSLLFFIKGVMKKLKEHNEPDKPISVI